MRKASWYILAVSLFLFPMLLSFGCDSSQRAANKDSSKVTSQADVDRQLKAIDENEHMPPGAKESAKANILNNQKSRAPVNAGAAKP